MTEILTQENESGAAASPGDERAAVARRRLTYAFMELSRRFDRRFESLRLAGRLGKWYSAVGNEATTVPAAMQLGAGDALCTLHRDLGAILVHYLDPRRAFPMLELGSLAPDAALDRRPDPEILLRKLACQLLGKGDGFSHGIERSFHYGYLDEGSDILHVGMISHLGSMIPVAAGCAWALRQRGSDRVAINFIGEGGTSTGDFHEGLNLAAVWKLPLILVIENNRYAFSTPAELQYAAASLADRGLGYGIPGFRIDGNDPDQVADCMRAAVARARRGDGPTLIEAMVGRMRGHSEGDDSLKVVPPEELREYLSADPVPAYGDRLEVEGVLDAELRRSLDQRADELVENAIESGLLAEAPDPRVARRPALALSSSGLPTHSGLEPRRSFDRPELDSGGRARPHEGSPPAGRPAPASSTSPARPEASPDGQILYVDAIHRALWDEMEADPSVVLLGQDIARFEGAFRVTRGLHERWPTRVLDTPIAESGALGAAAGAALLGFRPVVEMQFADFVSCGFNQLVNVIAKLYYRFEVPCPVVVRLPAGGGVGAGAFHSQNPEAWFTHVAGLKVVCPATAEDAYWLLRAAIQDPNPVVFCEHKFLYRRVRGQVETLADPAYDCRLGVASVRRPGAHLTMVGYGRTTWTCLDAAERLAEQGIEAEVVDLRCLAPFDEDTVLRSVQKTGRALIVHEAPMTSGFGGEVAARIAERGFEWLDAPVRRLAFADRPVPYVKALEEELAPTLERVIEAAIELARF